MKFPTRFTQQAKVAVPIICGAMYPCSNPELVASASEQGALGIVQPLSMVYVHNHDFRQGLQLIKSLTNKPFGVNILVEKSSSYYEKKMECYLEIALEEGCRFVITALGNPSWVVKKVKAYQGVVYHDVTERKWALRALNEGVDGLICVNNRAGGHAGMQTAQALFESLQDLNLPLICAGGIGDERDFVAAIRMGYDGVQMGTRFIATLECKEKNDYKQAIVMAQEKDIVLTNKVTGIPLSVINTPYVQAIGTQVNPLSQWLLQNRMTKRFMRIWYGLQALRRFKQITLKGGSSKDYWQAGKSVTHIHEIESVATIIKRFQNALSSSCDQS